MNLAAGIVLTVAACGRLLYGQTGGATPAFDAVSIKPSPPPSGRAMTMGSRGGPGTRDPSLYTTENYSVANLLTDAFGVDWYQISGPEWIRYANFDIAARVPSGATKPDLRLMLQTMLVERFGLKFHREKKEAPGYLLTVAKNGPRLTPAADPVDGERSVPDAPPVFGPPTLDKDGFPVIPKGSSVRARGGRDGRRTERFDRESMEKFAVRLSGALGRPVQDATGLQGEYDFLLRWVTDPGGAASDDAAPVLPGPTIFAALQQQLGLKLESSKTEIDFVVIDHIEKRPTEN